MNVPDRSSDSSGDLSPKYHFFRNALRRRLPASISSTERNTVERINRINLESNPKEVTMCKINTQPLSIQVQAGDVEPRKSFQNIDKKKEEKGYFGILTPTQEFCLLAGTMFFFFGLHNILQEAMMRVEGFHGVMLGYMEVLGVTAFSFLERRYVAKETGTVAPMASYPLLTGCLMASSTMSNMSLNYINFPTKVVFRSCKLIPTMMIATIINKRVFKSIEYVAAIAISIGLIFFTAADWKLTPSFNSIGLILVSFSVIADAILPNAQEKVFNMGASRLEVTYFTNLYTLIAMTCTTLMSGDLLGVIKLACTSDSNLVTFMIVYTIISYVAISSFMTIVKKYGGVTAVLLGTTRKAMTLILSFLLFPKDFSWMYVLGAGLVLGGLLVASLLKQYSKKEENDKVEDNDLSKPLIQTRAFALDEESGTQ